MDEGEERKEEKKRDNIPLKNIDRCRNRRVVQRKKTGREKERKET